MALIKCPHCGQEVSDSIKNCIHCGQSLTKPIAESDSVKKQSDETKINFNKQPIAEKTRLRNEFYNKYPKYFKAHKLNVFLDKGIKTIIYVATILFMFLWFTVRLLAVKNILTSGTFAANFLAIILTFLLAIIIILLLISLFLIPKRRYRAMLIEKRFWKFITVEKNMDYTVNFDSKGLKNKEVFDYINMDVEDL